MTDHAWQGFDFRMLPADGAQLAARVSEGSPSQPVLLLLHGFPQSHLMWRKMVGHLTAHFRLVVPDLPGYGDSSKPPAEAGVSASSKREMARHLVHAMRALGHERFHVAGHDRGGRVAHRLALDHPTCVRRLMVLDIAPTLAMYEQTGMTFARRYWWWFFLIQPAPLPERLIAGDPRFFLEQKIGKGPAGLAPFEGAYDEYLRHVTDPATLHAMCDDYRAAAGIDLEHDRSSRAAGQRIRCPLRAVWSATGAVGQCFDPLSEWRQAVDDTQPVTGEAWPCGHYIPEEMPEQLAQDMINFFSAGSAA